MHDFRRIVVGVDTDRKRGEATPGSQKAALQAAWLAKRNGGRVLLVASTYADGYGELVTRTDDGVVYKPEEAAREALAKLARELAKLGVECDQLVRGEKAWLAITRMVLRDEADLVIIGKRTQEKAGGRRLGAVSTKLLRKCPGPVWVVKPEHDLVHRLVLAATDLTPVGDEATRCAAWLAASQGCELHLVHAYQVPLQVQMEAATMSEEEYAAELERLRASAELRMRKALEGLELEKEPVLHVVRTSPTLAIREAVEHLNPDLLVMGMISRGGIAGLLVGDTAERLLDVVDCSLLTVKPDDFVTPVELD